MNGRGEDGWTIRVAGDDSALNFLQYVNHAYGLNEGDVGTAIAWPDPVVRLNGERLRTLLDQWKQVWERRLRLKADTVFAPEEWRSYAYLDPPRFERTRQLELRECFSEAWPDFHRWWSMPAGGQAALSAWEGKPDLIGYVRRFEREAGRRIRPFRLHVDLVYAGVREPLPVSDSYFVMSPDRDCFWNEEWWHRLFRERY